MNLEQPGASTSSSSSSTSSLHLVTFVFDCRLSRERYVKLIEINGVLHRLVQRLIEKHGGETILSIAPIITANHSSSHLCFRQDFCSPTQFLTSLPSFAVRFLPAGSMSRLDKQWPPFSGVTRMRGSDLSNGLFANRKRKLTATVQTALTEGLMEVMEVLDRRTPLAASRTASQTLLSLSPEAAAPVLPSLYPPQSPISASRKYLIMVMNDLNEAYNETELSNGERYDESIDETAWESIIEKSKQSNVQCSCILFEAKSQDTPGQTPNLHRRIRTLCEETSEGPWNDPWFWAPSDAVFYLSGFAIHNRPVHLSPTPVQDPSIDTKYSITPINTAADIPNATNMNTAQRQQLAQNNALRILQAQMARTLGNPNGFNPAQLSPAVLQNLMVAAKNGNIDLSNPALQQFKNLLMLQQQQKLNQQSIGSGGSAGGSAGESFQATKTQPTNTEMVSPATGQNKGMNPVNNGLTDPNLASNTKRPVKLWSGDIAFAMNNAAPPPSVRIPVDAFPYNTSTPQDVHLHLWPSELRISNTVQISLTDLQDFAKLNRTPCVIFLPSGSGPPGSSHRYQQFTASLNSKGTIALIPFGQPDRGIVLFAGPTFVTDTQGQRVPRLMGVVCLTVPFPNGRSQAGQGAPIPQPTRSTQPPMSQPYQQENSAQVFSAAALNPQQPNIHPLNPGPFPVHQVSQNYQQLLQPQNLQNQSQQNFQSTQTMLSQQSMAPQTNATASGRINQHSIQTIMDAAVRAKVALPSGFDPNSMSQDRLESILRLIQSEEAKNRMKQQQQQMEQIQGAQSQQAQLLGQQMRSGAGQYMQS